MGLCYFYRLFSWLDAGHITRLKRIFYAVIIDAKHGLAGVETTFDFKYIPEYETVTEMKTPRDIKLRGNSIEMRNLTALGIFTSALGLGVWVSFKAASSALGRVW